MEVTHLLLVDDEPAIHHAFQKVFGGREFSITKAMTGAEGLKEFEQDKPDVVILDIKLPDESGLNVFEKMRAMDARVPVIFITGHGTAEFAIEAMKRGAFEYLLKPLELVALRNVIDEASETSRRMRIPASVPDKASFSKVEDLLIGQCPKMQNVYKAIGRVAPQNVTVLISGESGVGKELVARAIYQHSPRASKPFLAINCAAIPDALLESELFGHERGAFTGADYRRIGKFEQCNGGTLFLDEVGDMSSTLQAKLLRALQEQNFERVGGSETIHTDVRIIAATNADLPPMVAKGKFRADLFFRLNVISITIPPLRDRGDDIELLTVHFARQYCREYSKEYHGITDQAMETLKTYSWPGNVRQLQSVLKQAALHSRDLEIGIDVVLNALPRVDIQKVGSAGFDWDDFVKRRIESGSESIYADALAEMESEIIHRVLEHTGGNQVQASRMLGIARGNLRNKLRSLRIVIDRSIETDE